MIYYFQKSWFAKGKGPSMRAWHGRFIASNKRCFLLAALWLFSLMPSLQAQTLTLETWRVDDVDVWTQKILPLFSERQPRIRVEMKATKPAEYDQSVFERITKGQAGDLITCRPFDRSLELFYSGPLVDITDMTELRRYRDHSKIAWTTYYADRVFCMPVASVMTGFFYNTRIFKELKLSPPKTEEELWAVLQSIQRSGKYQPLAFGTKDAWQAAQVLFAGIGPNYWKGEQGRLNLIKGRAKFTDNEYVEAWRALARFGDYLPKNHTEVGESEARELFLSGRAAIYPAGSWEIRFLTDHPKEVFDVFAPPPKSTAQNCYQLSHFDQGIGINLRSPHQRESREFLSWLSTPEFSQQLSNHLHGFIPLTNYPLEVSSPMVNEMLTWSKRCDTTIRINSQFMNQSWIEMENEMWATSAKVLRRQITPEAASEHIQQGLEKWFRPI
jgi:raffinose/stachyose/melibiose transport system substrate-binding protein